MMGLWDDTRPKRLRPIATSAWIPHVITQKYEQ